MFRLFRFHISYFYHWWIDWRARVCLEKNTPSNAELKEMTKRTPPPQEWYDEDDDFFIDGQIEATAKIVPVEENEDA